MFTLFVVQEKPEEQKIDDEAEVPRQSVGKLKSGASAIGFLSRSMTFSKQKRAEVSPPPSIEKAADSPVEHAPEVLPSIGFDVSAFSASTAASSLSGNRIGPKKGSSVFYLTEQITADGILNVWQEGVFEGTIEIEASSTGIQQAKILSGQVQTVIPFEDILWQETKTMVVGLLLNISGEKPLRVFFDGVEVEEPQLLLSHGLDLDAFFKTKDLEAFPSVSGSNCGAEIIINLGDRKFKCLENVINVGEYRPFNDVAFGNYPALEAAKSGHVPVVELLLALESDKENLLWARDNDDGSRLFHFLSAAGAVELVSDLIIFFIQNENAWGQSEIEATSSLLKSAGHYAAAQGHGQIIEILADNDLDLSKKDMDGRTAVHLAAEKGHVDAIVKINNKKKGLMEERDDKGATPTWISAHMGHAKALSKILEIITEGGYSAEAGLMACGGPNDVFETPMFAAAANGHKVTMKIVYDMGADPDQANANDETPAWIAASRGHLKAMTYLAFVGADLTRPNKKLVTPAAAAAKCGNVPILSFLFDTQRPLVKARTKATPISLDESVTDYLKCLAILSVEPKNAEALKKKSTLVKLVDGKALLVSAGTGEAMGSRALCGLGEALLAFGDDEGAEAAFKAASLLDRKDPAPHCLLGELLLDLRGAEDEAEAAFRESLAFEPKGHRALLGLGRTLKARGDLAKARGELDKLVRLDGFDARDPSNALAFYHLGSVLRSLASKSESEVEVPAATLLQQAKEKYEAAIKLEPGLAAAHYHLSALLRATKEAGADERYREAQALNRHGWEAAALAAAGSGQADALRFLAESGVRVDAPDSDPESGLTPALAAAKNGSVAALEVLRDARADIFFVKDRKGRTPFWFAAENDSVAALAFIRDSLLANGTKAEALRLLNEPDGGGRTPAYAAAFGGKVKALEFLLLMEADLVETEDQKIKAPDHKEPGIHGKADEAGKTATHGKVDEAAKTPMLDKADGTGKTPAMAAAEQDRLQVLKVLRDANGNLFKRDTLGRTAVFFAAQKGNDDILTVLRKAKAPPGTNKLEPDENGWTPIMAAVYEGNESTVYQLLVDWFDNRNAEKCLEELNKTSKTTKQVAEIEAGSTAFDIAKIKW